MLHRSVSIWFVCSTHNNIVLMLIAQTELSRIRYVFTQTSQRPDNDGVQPSPASAQARSSEHHMFWGGPDFNLFWFMAPRARGRNPAHPFTLLPSPSAETLPHGGVGGVWFSSNKKKTHAPRPALMQQWGIADKMSEGLVCRLSVLSTDNGVIWVMGSDTLQHRRQSGASPGSGPAARGLCGRHRGVDKLHACTQTAVKTQTL